MPLPSRTGVRGLYKDADGRYRIDLRWTDRNGAKHRHKEVLPPGTTAGAARRRAQDVLTDALAGTLSKRDKSKPATLGDAFNRYLEWCAVNKPNADPKYKERHRDAWIKTLGGGFELANISELAIERHKKRRKDEGKQAGTINRELVTLKHFLNRCVDWEWLDKVPKVTLLREPPPRVRWLTDDERAKLDKHLPQRVKRVALAAALSGIRLSNLLQLTIDRVDFEHRTITIPLTKSGKAQHVPISDELAVVLKEAIDDRGKAPDSPYVFLSRLGKPYSRHGASLVFRRACLRAGIKDLHIHDLRHDFATRIRRAGHGLDVVQALLGHASPAMSQRYAHLGEETLHAAVGAAATFKKPAKRSRRKAPAKKTRQKRGA